MANDAFVEIARTGAGGRKELLHEPKPIPHDTKKCILTEPDGKSIETVKKMNKWNTTFKCCNMTC